MSKLEKFLTEAGPISLSKATRTMVDALKGGATNEQATHASGLSLRHVLRQRARPQICALINPATPLVTVKLPRRVAAAIERMFEGATARDAAEQAGITWPHLRKHLDRPEVDLLFKAKTREILMSAVPRAEQIMAAHRRSKRGNRGRFAKR